jgi:hypothetical protein
MSYTRRRQTLWEEHAKDREARDRARGGGRAIAASRPRVTWGEVAVLIGMSVVVAAATVAVYWR